MSCSQKENKVEYKMPNECAMFEPRLIAAVIEVESGGNMFAKGDSGKSLGLMQVKVTTAQVMGFTGPKLVLHNTDINLKYGCMYLYDMYLKSNRNIYVALDCYSRGPQRVKLSPYHGKWEKHPYVGRIIKAVNSH